MANETVLLRSGDIYFSKSEGGCSITLPSNKKLWLNEQIIDMMDQIIELQKTVPGKDGKDGHSVEMKTGVWPEGSPDILDNQYVLWKWMDRDTFVDTWKPLIAFRDIKGQQGEQGEKGDRGEKGDKGEQGINVNLKGSVKYEKDLTHLTSVAIGDGYMVTSTQSLWRLGQTDWTVLGNWDNLGKIVGPKGDKGDRGEPGKKGAKGDKGSDGSSISMFLVQWMVNAATSAAISGAMNEVSSMVNDAINDAINQMMDQMEDAMKEMVEQAVEDALEDIKGEKGDKGDDGEKGEPGKTFQLVGRFDTVALFNAAFPPSEDTLSFAAMIGPDDGTELDLWAVVQNSFITGVPATYSTKNFGKLKGPKGADATWNVSVRDEDFVEKMEVTVESDLPNGVAGMYMQESSSISITATSGSQASAKQVGFKLEMKYPIPKLVKEGDGSPVHPETEGLVLGNDGEKLVWVEGGTGGGAEKEEILLKGADSTVWALHIDDYGNLHQDMSTKNTEKTMLQLVSPSKQKWGITIDRNGRLNVSEVF